MALVLEKNCSPRELRKEQKRKKGEKKGSTMIEE